MLSARALRRASAASRTNLFAVRRGAAPYSTHLKEQATSDPHPTKPAPNESKTNEVPVDSMGSFDARLSETVEEAREIRTTQAPNRKGVWSRNQRPREQAMVGPRFEQMIMQDQPRPYAAVELIHKQPVRWRKERIVACDGGGGPLGHPRIFINLDKPEINACTYCGLPFANEHHREHIESLTTNTYPLAPTGHPAEVPESQKITNEPLAQR